MNKVNCVYCGGKIDSDAKFCNHCGSSVQTRDAAKKVSQEETSGLYSYHMENTNEEKIISSRKPITRNVRRVIIGLIIITGVLVVVLPASLIPLHKSYSFYYLGTTTFTSGSLVTTNASLII
ncbi:MAG: zinc ribbon domain-containing protein, partial [Asgard group archaeon]|nr:zinc ribbon domain-containing protein [Asgard group archaeon]